MITFLGSVSCYMYGGGEPGTRMSFACGIYKWPLVMPVAVSLRSAQRRSAQRLLSGLVQK